MRALILVLGLGACARAASPPVAPAVAKHPPTAQIHRFVIGALPAVALKDGDLHEKNDGQTFGLGHAPAEVSALFGHDTATIDLSVQPLLVQDAGRTFLFDTGALRPTWAPEGGGLIASLQLAGVAPASVTDIFISHGHDDHVGGLLTTAGGLAFPNATIHVSTPEWAAMKARKEQVDLVAAIASKVVPFAPGAALFPSVTAVPVEGHTPGHSAYAIRSGDERMLYLGDSAHHSVISVRRPDWPVDYDTDKELARRSRHALLERAAAEHTRIYAVHFPFPGIGTIAKTEDGFSFVAEADRPALPPPPRVTVVDAGAPAAPVVAEEDPLVAWRAAQGVTAWPPAVCATRAMGDVYDECHCEQRFELAHTPLLVCGRVAEIANGTGIGQRTLVFRATGKTATLVFDQVTSIGEDDALPNDVMGVRLEVEATNDALVLDDKGTCPASLAAIAETVKMNAGARTGWPTEAAAYRAVCARRGRYVLEGGRLTRATSAK